MTKVTMILGSKILIGCPCAFVKKSLNSLKFPGIILFHANSETSTSSKLAMAPFAGIGNKNVDGVENLFCTKLQLRKITGSGLTSGVIVDKKEVLPVGKPVRPVK